MEETQRIYLFICQRIFGQKTRWTMFNLWDMFFQVSGKLPRGKLPPDNCSPSNCPLDDCPGLFPPGQLSPVIITPQGKFLHGQLPPGDFPPNYFLIIFSRTIAPNKYWPPLSPRAFPPCLTPPELLTPTINASKVIVTNLLKKPQACHCQVCYSFLFTHWIPKRIFIQSKFR